MASAITLSGLPEETIRQIGSYLDLQTLQSFSLASKRFLPAADVVLFRRITITILGRKKLQLDLDRWAAILERSSAFKHVHVLSIDGYMPLEEEDKGEVTPTAEVKKRFLNISPEDTPLRHDKPEDECWLPLAQFLGRLPAIDDIKFRCANQFPAALLRALHQRPFPSRCKLHLNSFRLRSLKEPALDPHEHAVITSPCLHSIKASLRSFEDDNGDDYNRDAIFRIASGLAPNLKSVDMSKTYFVPPTASTTTAVQPWKGISFDTQKQPNDRGSVTVLKLSNAGLQEMIAWRHHIDFTKLRTLSIYSFREDYNVAAWLQCLRSYDFGSLTCLDIFMTQASPNDEYYQAVNSFLKSLKPLRSLYLNASLTSDAFEAIAERHGSSLRHLSFICDHEANRPDTEFRVLEQLEKHCHLLESLSLNISRSKGDAREVGIYKRLGALPNVRSLMLRLNSTRYSPIQRNNTLPMATEPSFDEFDEQLFSTGGETVPGPMPRNGHICEHFINAAIDEALGRSIFDVVSAAKRNSSQSIQCLSISPGREIFGYYCTNKNFKALCQVSNVIGGSWSLRLNPICMHDTQGQVKAVNHLLDYSNKERAELPDVLDPGLEAVFRKVWPRRENDTGNWKEDWHSFPLETA